MAKRRFRSRGRFSRLRRRRRIGARRLKKFIKRTFRRMSEVKYATTITNGYVNTDPSSFIPIRLNPIIAQGADKSERIGNRIRYKFMQIRCIFNVFDGAQPANPFIQHVRVLIVQPRLIPAAGVGAGPSLAEVFDDGINNIAGVVSSIRNTAIRVIMDRTYTMSTVGNGASVQLPSGNHFKKKVRISNNVNYYGSGNTLPLDPKDNYYMYFVSDATGAGEANIAYNLHTRISFIDV